MRMMSYKVRMEDCDKYLISNANVSWNLMPQKENLRAPGIRIKDEPYPKGHTMCGQMINTDDYIKPFFSDDVLSECRDNYLQAVHGELKGWKLIAICIEKNHIELTVAKNEECCENFEITAAPYLRFSVEAPTFGGKTAQYLIEAVMKDPNGLDPSKNKAYTRIVVTEYDEFSERRIVFDNHAPFDVEYTRSEWIEVSVMECS